jgi:SAM-dependent methyltransferase
MKTVVRTLCVSAVIAVVASSAAVMAAGSGQERRRVRIFPPAELGTLEGPDRELYTKPDQIMDVLGIADGSVVGEVGAGGGWFTVRLARRVGPQGLVYAEDIQEAMIDSIERRMQREGLTNVRTVLGTAVDARLPDGALDAVLIVESYYEFELLSNLKDSLKPNGRIAIVDYRKDGFGPGPLMEDRVDESVVIEKAEAAGLRLVSRETFLPYEYMLVFGRRESVPDSTGAQTRRPNTAPHATRGNSRVPPTATPPSQPATPQPASPPGVRPPESARPPAGPPQRDRF